MKNGEVSEIKVQLDAQAVTVTTGILAVGQTPDVVNPEDGENVVNSHTSFHIGLAPHGQTRSIARELKDVIALQWIVFVAQATPDALKGEHFTQS